MPEPDVVKDLLSNISLTNTELDAIENASRSLVAELREDNNPTLMENFLGEYGLSTCEGVGLMCLAKALLRQQPAVMPAYWAQ